MFNHQSNSISLSTIHPQVLDRKHFLLALTNLQVHLMLFKTALVCNENESTKETLHEEITNICTKPEPQILKAKVHYLTQR